MELPPVIVPEPPPGIGREFQLQGYIGGRVIRAVFGEQTAAGSAGRGILLGHYRALGDSNDHLLTMQTIEPESDPEASEQREATPPDDAQADTSFSCSFEEKTNGKITASLDAKCNKTKDPYDLSNNPEEVLTIQGAWTPFGGATSEPFFLGSIPESYVQLDELLPGILGHWRVTRRCAPYVRLNDIARSAVPNRAWHTYSLRWPCEEPQDVNEPPAVDHPKQSRSNPVRRLPTTVGLLAEFNDQAPRQMTFGPVNLGGIGSDTALHVRDLEVALGDAHLYAVYAESVDEAGPNAFHCCWRRIENRNWLFASSPDGTVSELLELPSTSAVTGMGCFDSSTELQLTLADLDGKELPEIIATTTVNRKQQRPPPPGSPQEVHAICVDLPEARKHKGYRYDRAKRQFQKLVVPPNAADAAIKRGKRLSFR